MKRKKFITTCKEFYLLIFITFLIFLLIIFSISWIMFANKYPKYIVSMGNFKRTRTLGNNYDTYIKEDDDTQTELDYPHYLNFVCILKCSSKKTFLLVMIKVNHIIFQWKLNLTILMKQPITYK